MDDVMSHVLGSRTELKHGQNLGARIESQPQPGHLGGAAQACANFVQLEVREVQVAETALMKKLSVPACAREPRGDSGLSIAEDPRGSRWVEPFGQRGQHHGDLL